MTKAPGVLFRWWIVVCGFVVNSTESGISQRQRKRFHVSWSTVVEVKCKFNGPGSVATPPQSARIRLHSVEIAWLTYCPIYGELWSGIAIHKNVNIESGSHGGTVTSHAALELPLIWVQPSGLKGHHRSRIAPLRRTNEREMIEREKKWALACNLYSNWVIIRCIANKGIATDKDNGRATRRTTEWVMRVPAFHMVGVVEED